MNTELTYLLEELNNYTDDKVILVQDLKKMIEKSFEKAAKDQEHIENILSEIGHDM